MRSLGNDDFGRSDTCERLLDFFEINAEWIVLHTLNLLTGQDGTWRTARDDQRFS